eukprot:TRINITY_DN38832_c0_g1_i1.p1 TRINITY_DN38832_c0_g1~~TRINITY_DN38832_c0_g1_i1.p1  ORF type:complete len:110 (+),score=8.26 TRINITY_DN38832_c0_g1_i1:25-330(+)
MGKTNHQHPNIHKTQIKKRKLYSNVTIYKRAFKDSICTKHESKKETSIPIHKLWLGICLRSAVGGDELRFLLSKPKTRSRRREFREEEDGRLLSEIRRLDF